jgi:hypothetical protein
VYIGILLSYINFSAVIQYYNWASPRYIALPQDFFTTCASWIWGAIGQHASVLSIRQRLRAHQTARHQEGDERETGDEKWISLQAERIFVTERASHWALIKGGMKAAWPICIGYIPLGFAFGVLAQKGPDGSSNGWT